MAKKIEWTTKKVKVADLKNFQDNPRKISEKNLAILKDSLEDFGQAEPLIVDTDMTVLSGNQRLRVIQSKDVWVRVPNRKLTKDEIKEIVVASNNEIGDWDVDMLADLGFSNEELIDVLGLDAEFVNDIGFDFDDFDFGEFDSPMVIKKLIVNFENHKKFKDSFEVAKENLGTHQMEHVLLELCKAYEKSKND